MSDAVTQKLERAFSAVPPLKGKENWVEWDMRIKAALRMSACREFIKEEEIKLAGIIAKRAWERQDKQIAATLLNATDFSILSAYFHLLDEPSKATDALSRVTLRIYHELQTTYGTHNAQYTFQLGRSFVSSSCAEGDDVEAWVNKVKAQYRELKALDFDLDAMCVNVLLNGLPDTFHAFKDSIWTTTASPSIDFVADAIVRINAGHRDAQVRDGAALVARMRNTRLGQRTRPSASNPCRICNSSMHWATDCPHQDGSGEVNAPAPAATPVPAPAAQVAIVDNGYSSAGSAF